jgi:hypothetical protein
MNLLDERIDQYEGMGAGYIQAQDAIKSSGIPSAIGVMARG